MASPVLQETIVTIAVEDYVPSRRVPLGCQRRWKDGRKMTVGNGVSFSGIEKPVADGYRLYS